MGEEYPVGAFIVTIIGAVFALLAWLLVSLAGVVGSAIAGPQGAVFGAVCIIISIIGSILGFLAAAWMRKPEKVHSGGILAIGAAIITIWAVLPFILLLIGGILALVWKGPEKKPVILPPPPPS